jgi:hypothetical protein
LVARSSWALRAMSRSSGSSSSNSFMSFSF